MKSKIKRGLAYLYKGTFLFVLYKIDHKIYMKFYNKLLKFLGVKVKNAIYIDYTAWIDSTDYSLIEIEDDVVISKNVTLLTHDYSIARALKCIDSSITKEYKIDKGIKIGKNSFIGINSTILPGTEIGENCIVGAGTVVRGKVESNSIIIGNPHIKVMDTREWGTKKKQQLQL